MSHKKKIAVSLALGLAVANPAFAHPDEDHKPATPTLAVAPVQTKGATTGQGDWVYKTVHNWGAIPGQDYIGSTHGGVAVDKSGKVYVSTDGPNGIIVYQPDGTFIKTLGEHSRRFHSLVHRVENGKEYLYAAGGHRVCKLDLDGNMLLSIEYKEGSEDRPWLKATAADVAPDGTIYVADGYGTNLIYKYSQDGTFLGKFGSRGKAPGQFATCHGLTIDDRNPERPLLVISDRENLRIQLLDLEGNVVNIPITGLRRPCSTSIRGDHILVAELAGRAVLLDKDYKILSVLGDNPVEAQRANFQVPPEEWKEGVFTAPHGCAIDADGDLYIQDWNRWGRITKLVKQ